MQHSHDFKRAAPYAGKRLLVIGGGNSACDVAVETARVAARVDLSWRRGYWIVPKFVFGVPSDHLHNLLYERLGFVPWRLRASFMETMLRLINGPNSAYGLPEPDHPFGATHPTLNSELLYFIRHGEIHPRPRSRATKAASSTSPTVARTSTTPSSRARASRSRTPSSIARFSTSAAGRCRSTSR